MPHRIVWKSAAGMAGLAVIVGAAGGLGAVGFEYLTQGVFHNVVVRLAGYTPTGPGGEPELFHVTTASSISPFLIVLLPALGGLLSGWLCFRFAPEARGHGTDAAIAAYHHRGGEIRPRVPLVKAIATALSLGTGGSGGREGPIAQIGAGFGSLLGGALRLSPRQRRVLMAAGMGAGVGAIFRAPLAGALFSAEILYRDPEIESEVVLPAFLSSAVAYCVFCGWFGEFRHLFTLSSGLVFERPIELLWYTALVAVLVPMIYLYVSVFYGAERLFARIPGPRALIAALGGLLTGLAALLLWRAMGDDRALGVLSAGYGILQDGLDGAIVGWEGARLLVLIAFVKILTTSFTIASGGSGGVFGPSMVIGGGLGGAIGIVGQQLGLVENPACFVIVGMSGFFAGAARTPISTIIMVSEMTGSYELLLPAMWVCALTFILCSPITLYRKQVKNRAWSPAHADEFRLPLLQDMRVADVWERERDFVSVRHDASLSEVTRLVARTHADYFPVLDGDGRFVGIFSAHDVRSHTYDETLHAVAVAADIMVTNPITVSPDDDLHTAMDRFSIKNIDELPVVDAEHPDRILGVLRRRAITRAYKERLDEISASRDSIF